MFQHSIDQHEMLRVKILHSLPTTHYSLLLLCILILSLRCSLCAEPSMPQKVTAIATQANEKYLEGELLPAEKGYQQALSMDPENSNSLNHLAAIKTRLGKSQEAEQLLRKSLQLKLENPAAWLLLGMNCLDQKRNDEAFAALIQATLYDPKNSRAQHYLGIAAGHKGWNEISETALRRALELDPNYGDAHFNLAVYYLRRTPPAIELARRHYQRALDLGVAHDAEIEALMKQPIKTE